MIGTKNQLITYLLVQDDSKKFEIKDYKERRGLRANRYYWSLVNELASVLKMSKEDIHKDMLKHYGVSDYISVREDINPDMYFKYYEKAGESVLKDKKFIHYKVYVESHLMDSKQFSTLLEGIIQECKQQDIETLEEKEVKEMMKEYEKMVDIK